MNNEKKHIIYSAKDIEQYLSGTMSNAEMHAIEKAALDDPLLSDAIEGYNAVDNKEWDKVLVELKEKITVAENTPIVSITKNSFARRWRVAAAVFLFGSSITIAYLFTAKNDAAKEPLASKTAAKESVDSIKNRLATTDSTTYIAANNTPVTNNKKELLIAAIDTRKPAKNKNASATIKQDNQPTNEHFVYQPGKPSAPATRHVPQSDDDKSFAENAGNKTITFNKEVQNKLPNNVANAAKAADVKVSDDNITNLAASNNQQNVLQPNASNFFNAQVVDAADHPLPFAQIKTAAQKPIVADANGNFSLAATDTTVTVNVTAAGYISKKYQLQNAEVPQIIRLEEDKMLIQKLAYTKKKSASSKTALIKEDNLKELEEEDDDIEPINGWVDYNNYLSQNLTISDQLKNSNIHGMVELLVKLKANGNVAAVKINKSLCADCDAEAIRLIKKGPKWDVKNNKGGRAKVKVQF